MTRQLLKYGCLLFLFTPVCAQNTPPTLQSVVPQGGQRGTTVLVLIDGTNLAGASRVLFNEAGLTAAILKNVELPNKRPKPKEGEVIRSAIIEDNSTRNRLTLSVEIGPGIKPGIYGFRVLTPLGVSNLLPFAVGAFPENDEMQINDSLDQAQPIELPVTVRGEISHPGDTDHFTFKAKAGQELVFQALSSPLDSKLTPQIDLLDATGQPVARTDDPTVRDPALIYKTRHSSNYCIRLSDAHLGSGNGYHYRLEATLSRDRSLTIAALRGESERPPSEGGRGLRADNIDPEQFEQEPNDSVSAAQAVSWPVVLKGKINGLAFSTEPNRADEDLFQFSARKGDRLVIEVEAERLGSPLDSVVEILDTQGKAVPRLTLRCVASTTVTLRDHDSKIPVLRFLSRDDFAINDLVMIGSEILQIENLRLPAESAVQMKSFRRQRATFFDTTPESHAVGDPIYKVKVFPPGTEFPPNGMPVFHLDYQNDDGGPMYGSDSRLNFVAPADGTYFVKIGDVRGFQGENYSYRLNVREPRPDFKLLANRDHLNVPPGGQTPLTVTAHRIDGFDGEIHVTLEDLPDDLSATSGTILPGEDSAVMVVKARQNASFPPVPLRVSGRAEIGGKSVARSWGAENELNLIALSLPPDIRVSLDRPQVHIHPGTEVQLTVRVDRQNGFRSRVPVDIANLPHGVRVLHIGLNGILVSEEEVTRTFTLYAEPWARSLRRPLYAVGRVETTSFIPLEHSSDPVELVVEQK